LAVVGSKGAPGASELAASFATIVARQWRLLLCELDGDGGQLALRLGADPREGSLLGLARAVKAHEPDQAGLLSHWLIDAGRGWPTVLLGSPQPPADLVDATGPGMVERLLTVLTESFPLVVCDVGQRLRRSNGDPDAATRLHRNVLASADAVVLVIGSRQEQLRAAIAQLELLLDELAVGPERLRVVVNGQPGTRAPRKTDTAGTISQELAAHGLTVDAWLPYDEKAQQASVRLGVPLAVARPRGAYARAVREFVEAVLLPGVPQPAARKRRLRPQARVQPPTPAPAASGEVTLPWRQ
jgi:Flp pilus assembly CpaE family ATPase